VVISFILLTAQGTLGYNWLYDSFR